MGFLRRRAERRELRAAALELQPAVEALREEIERTARTVRAEFQDLPGFPPICESCDRVMVYRRVRLSRKKWRWMWHCGGCSSYVYNAVLKREGGGISAG